MSENETKVEQVPTSSTPEEKTELKRALGLGYATIFGVGLILGAGVYALIIPAMAKAGGLVWASVLFATLIAILTAFSYAEFASLFPRAASTHLYIEKTFPKYRSLAFVSGWLIAFEGIAGAATASVGFALYLVRILNIDPILIPIIAIILIAILTVVNWIGIEESTKLILVFTAIEAGGLLLVVFIGMLNPTVPNPAYFEIPTQNNGAFDIVSGTLAIMLGAATFYFAFTGFELQPTLAEEVKEPRKNVPKAIIYALLVCALLYLLVAIAVVRLVTVDSVINEEVKTLADAVRNVDPNAFYILSFIALFSTSNTVLGFLVAGSRLIYGLAEEGYLPETLAVVDKKRKTPYMAIILASVVSVFIILTTIYVPYFAGWETISAESGGELLDLVGRTASLAALLVFVLINLAVIIYRFANPHAERPFKIPSLALPLIGALLTMVFIAVSFWEEIIWFNTILIALIGFAMYIWETRTTKKQ